MAHFNELFKPPPLETEAEREAYKLGYLARRVTDALNDAWHQWDDKTVYVMVKVPLELLSSAEEYAVWLGLEIAKVVKPSERRWQALLCVRRPRKSFAELDGDVEVKDARTGRPA